MVRGKSACEGREIEVADPVVLSRWSKRNERTVLEPKVQPFLAAAATQAAQRSSATRPWCQRLSQAHFAIQSLRKGDRPLLLISTFQF